MNGIPFNLSGFIHFERVPIPSKGSRSLRKGPDSFERVPIPECTLAQGTCVRSTEAVRRLDHHLPGIG